MHRLHLYTLFHCNLAFSMIERASFPSIVQRCYWPVLRLAEDDFPVAIEMPAWTLKEVNSIDPSFVLKLKELWRAGKCEFVGSGYSQAIFPLIPAEVNRWNLELGNKHYQELLGKKPEVALVNEQTFSRGLVDLYKKAGYKTIIMDWNNSHKYNNYPKEYVYFPQKAVGNIKDIDVIWSHSIAFQKFQRCVHGSVTEEEYFDFLNSHYSPTEDRAFVLYTNDAEVFDFRPGAEEIRTGEWERLKALLAKIKADERFLLVTPNDVAGAFKGRHKAFNKISLESPETPIVCKKQEKYNPTRWAVAGRDSVHVNTECYKVYRNIKALLDGGGLPEHTADEFKETICDLWGSDFRSNTIDEKFIYFQNKAGWLKMETERLLKGTPCGAGAPGSFQYPGDKADDTVINGASANARLTKTDSSVKIITDTVEAEFLTHKGFALKSLAFPGVFDKPLLGTLAHGYYDDIRLGADFFSGHIIHVSKDGKKTTDLKGAEMQIEEGADNLIIKVHTSLDIGTLTKMYDVSRTKPSISVTYRLKVNGLVASSLRLGIFTFMPSSFDKDTLWFETVNGGAAPERFSLKGRALSHDEPVSQSVSASSCLGATEGWVKIGDKDKSIKISTDKSRLYSVPMLKFMELKEEDSFFLRLYHSVGEVDDTAWWVWRGVNEITFDISANKE
ncbi:MAG: hypothetical protein HY954_06745 [Deltaproteobacteria bacterium]|nr:hypothetical protein [Deltaproteobacteria bacterium]